ncbi:MAG: hypothetical protein ABI295_01225 [Xanthomarina sp.]
MKSNTLAMAITYSISGMFMISYDEKTKKDAHILKEKVDGSVKTLKKGTEYTSE